MWFESNKTVISVDIQTVDEALGARSYWRISPPGVCGRSVIDSGAPYIQALPVPWSFCGYVSLELRSGLILTELGFPSVYIGGNKYPRNHLRF
jgi:hypothetical protein